MNPLECRQCIVVRNTEEDEKISKQAVLKGGGRRRSWDSLLSEKEGRKVKRVLTCSSVDVAEKIQDDLCEALICIRGQEATKAAQYSSSSRRRREGSNARDARESSMENSPRSRPNMSLEQPS